MPSRKCGKSSCRTYIDFSERFCEKHRNLDQSTYNKHVRHNLYNSDYTDFYNSTAWRKLSKRHKAQNPLCIRCFNRGIIKQAEITDHIIELRDDFTKRLDPSNLQSLCRACHNIKSKEEEAKRKRSNSTN